MMIQFLYKHKKARGVITVFLTMTYLTVYMFTGLLVDGGRVKMAQTAIEDVQQIATENVMSQYNRGLYEYYGLFGVSNKKVDEISKEVQSQIEESIGLKIPQDNVKNFIYNVTTKTDKLKEEDIKGYVSDAFTMTDNSKDLFNPYGIKVEDTRSTYIDLTNEDVFRAQIRDEMRYTAPLVLGANFFSAINEFMATGGGSVADAISNVAQTIDSLESQVGSKKEKYYNSIGAFSEEFRQFVVKTYAPKFERPWGAIEIANDIWDAGVAVADWLDNVMKTIESIPGIGPLIKTWLDPASAVKPIREKRKEIATDLKILGDGIDKALNDTANNLVYKIIRECKNNINRFTEAFDNQEGWPEGEELDERRVSDGEGGYTTEYYYGSISRRTHKAEAIQEAEERKRKYDEEIQGVLVACDKVIDALEKAKDSLTEYMQLIDEVEGKLLNFYKSTNDNRLGEKARDVYKKYMAIYLKEWDSLATQQMQLSKVKDRLDDLKKQLEGYEEASSRMVENVSNENFSLSWDHPTRSKLKQYRTNNVNGFQAKMEDLATSNAELGGIIVVQKIANGEGEKNNIFETINCLVNLKKSNTGESLGEDVGALFGKIKRRTDTDNVPYDPLADKTITEGLYSEDDPFNEDLNDKNIAKKVMEIMNIAKNIVGNVLGSIAGNIYDETYILSHCRDYVHTYRYPKLLKEGKINENTKNLDTVLNPKFINNQSNIHYLDNEQFSSIQVTPAEIEYIIFGNVNATEEETMACVVKMYASIFIIRLALNYIAATTSPNSALQCDAIAAPCLIFAPAVRLAAPLIYAIPQSIYETKLIMYDCKKANVWNGGADLQLWSSFTDILGSIVEDAKNDLKEKIKKSKDQIIENTKKGLEELHSDINNRITIESVRSKGPIGNIAMVIDFFDEENIFHTMMESVSINADKFYETTTKSTEINVDNELKAGYSDYLLIYLFLNGIDKKSQIIKLQSVIETNMSQKKVQEGFELRNTFGQIAVEVDSSIKFIFMDTTFMRRMFTSTSSFKNKRFGIKTKTAYAY